MDAAAGLKNALVGDLCGLADGAIAGALFAWCYNKSVDKFTARTS